MYRRLIILGLVLFGVSTQFSSCQCSSSGGDSEASLSKYDAVPGEVLSLKDSGIVAGSSVTLSFKGANGFSMDIPVSDTEDGVAYFAVPVFVDTTAVNFADGALASGEVTVSINGKSLAKPLMIQALPSLSGIQPGFIYKQFLQASREEYNLAKQAYTQMANDGYDVSAVLASIDQRLADLDNVINQLDQLMAGNIGSIPMGDTSLTADDIRQMEQVMAAYVSGAADYLGFSTPVTKSQGKTRDVIQHITEADCLQAAGGNTDAAAYKMCVNIVRKIEYIISETKRGVKGAAALLASITVGVAVWAQASAGWAAVEIGKAAGIALAYLRAGFDMASSAVTDKLSNAFNDDNRSSFEDGKKFIKNAVDVGVQWISSVPGKVGEFFSWISTGSTVLDGANDIDKARCDTSSNKVTVVALAASTDPFCDDYDPSVINQVSFLLVDVLFDGNFADASQSFLASEVMYPGSVTYYEGLNEITIDGYPSIYGTSDKGMHFFLVMNKATINGPGSYPVTTDDVVPYENGYVSLFVDSPAIVDEDSKAPTGFDQVSGTLNLEAYGENIGDRIKGTFDIDIHTSRIVCLDTPCDNYQLEDVTGNANGLFDGFLQDPAVMNAKYSGVNQYNPQGQ